MQFSFNFIPKTKNVLLEATAVSNSGADAIFSAMEVKEFGTEYRCD
jgi:hypothetical protein